MKTKKQNDSVGKSTLSSSCTPLAEAEKQSFSWTSVLAVHSKSKLWNREFWNRPMSSMNDENRG